MISARGINHAAIYVQNEWWMNVNKCLQIINIEAFRNYFGKMTKFSLAWSIQDHTHSNEIDEQIFKLCV